METALLAGATGALVVCIWLRSLPRRRSPRSFPGTDRQYHLYYIDLIRRHGHRVPRRDPAVVGEGECIYPAALHVALSYLSPRAVAAADRHLGLACDLVLGATTAAMLGADTDTPPALAVAFVALYLIAPAMTLMSIGPRAFSLTPRPVAQLFNGLAGLALVKLVAGDPPTPAVVFAAAVVLLAAALLVAKFALQQSALVLPVFAALVWDPTPLAALALATVVAVTASKGFFVRQVRGQVCHLLWYVRFNQAFVAHRGDWRALASALRRRSAGLLWQEVVINNAITAGLFRHPHLLLVAALFAAGRLDGPDAGAHSAYVAASVAVWIVTSIGAARVLGEAERYLEFAFPFGWVLLLGALTEAQQATLLGLAFAYSVAVYTANLRLVSQQCAYDTTAAVDRLLAALQPHVPARGLSLYVTESFAFLRLPGLQMCVWNGTTGACGRLGEFVTRLVGRYPYASTERFGELIRAYDIDIVIANRRAYSADGVPLERSYDLERCPLVVETEEYHVYDVRPLRELATP